MIPLVLVHGLMGSGQQWQDQRKALGDRLNVITPDLPGFGANAGLTAPDSITGFARWVLDDLTGRGVEHFHLLGHSMGGMIAQDMIRLAPARVARLILYGTGAEGILPGRFEPVDTSKSRAVSDGARATAQRISATWFLAGEDAPGHAPCAAIAAQSSLQAILAGLDAMKNWSGLPHLATIQSETLVIWGDRDRTYPWAQTETLWRGINGAQLAVLPGCAHAVHLEKPDLFNRVLADFLTVRVFRGRSKSERPP